MMKPKEDRTMKELWRIKRKLSKEIEGKSFEELKRWLDEGKKSCKEKARKFKETVNKT